MKRKSSGKMPVVSNDRKMTAAMQYLYKRIDQITPSIYAAFALALDERGWDVEQIAELFARTQDIWAESTERNEDMVEYCSEHIGIDVRAGKMGGE